MCPEQIVPTFYVSGTNRSNILSLRNKSFQQRSCPFRLIVEQLSTTNVARSCRRITWHVERYRARVSGIQNVRCFPFCPEESFRHFFGPERIVPAPANTLKPYLRSNTRGKTD
jgi:hypothetical protein